MGCRDHCGNLLLFSLSCCGQDHFTHTHQFDSSLRLLDHRSNGGSLWRNDMYGWSIQIRSRSIRVSNNPWEPCRVPKSALLGLIALTQLIMAVRIRGGDTLRHCQCTCQSISNLLHQEDQSEARDQTCLLEHSWSDNLVGSGIHLHASFQVRSPYALEL
jgi:hypothetical protein